MIERRLPKYKLGAKVLHITKPNIEFTIVNVPVKVAVNLGGYYILEHFENENSKVVSLGYENQLYTKEEILDEVL